MDEPTASSSRGPSELDASLAAFASRVASAPITDLAGVAAHLFGIAAEVWLRVLTAAPHQKPTVGGSLDDIRLLTTKQLAELWGLPEQKIRELCRTGKLPAKKLAAKEWFISAAALREWMPPAVEVVQTHAVEASQRRTGPPENPR